MSDYYLEKTSRKSNLYYAQVQYWLSVICNEIESSFTFTDASGIGVITVLEQRQEDNVLHPLVYFSRILRAERKKEAIYVECSVVKEAL